MNVATIVLHQKFTYNKMLQLPLLTGLTNCAVIDLHLCCMFVVMQSYITVISESD